MVSAIIVAAGKGIRMKDSMRKQYSKLSGRPILSHTLLAVNGCDLIQRIILVVPKDDVDFCHEKIIVPLKLCKQIELIAGGEERQDSVFNGLQALDDREGLVVIHDGVRPFVTAEQFTRCIEAAKDTGACILAIPVLDTVKKEAGAGWIAKTLDRAGLWLAQTPQVFDFKIITQAHNLARREGFKGSDDSLLVERLGYKVQIIRGTRSNIKITTQEDLLIGEAILKRSF
jgi:2-C-methyl-D-erythritol 4-phosphate cytidylyltransferase